MATIKALKYYCPHCGKKLPESLRNEFCVVDRRYYGDPREACKRCKGSYTRADVTEAAQGLMLRRQVPFWMISPRAMELLFVPVSLFMAAVWMGVPNALALLPFAVLPYPLSCALTRRHRHFAAVAAKKTNKGEARM